MNHKKINEIRERYGGGVKLDWVGRKSIPMKKVWKYPIDLNGKGAFRDSFKICNRLICIRMKNGRIYPCNTTACIDNFNKDLELIPGKDYLELEKIENI